MTAIDDLAQVVARQAGKSVDDVKPALDNALNEAEADQLLRGYQPGNAREQALVSGGRILADQPQRIADNTLSQGRKTVLGAGAITGGTLVGFKGAEAYEAQQNKERQQEQAAALQEIIESPNLSQGQREELIKRLTSTGFFDSPSSGSDGGGSLFGNLINTQNLVQIFLALIIVYFLGKALVNAADNRGGNGGGN
jgi:hypothetical protein